jgi:predicted RNase H-like nuclease (RuvC/YqgF family)
MIKNGWTERIAELEAELAEKDEEIERLREALKGIVGINPFTSKGAEIMQERARQALKEQR